MRSDASLEKWTRRFELPILIVALLVIPAILIEASSDTSQSWRDAAAVLNWIIWVVFTAEVALLLAVAPDRKAWLRHHLLDVAIVLLTTPFMPAALQLVRAARLIRLIRLFQLLRLVRTTRALRRLFTAEGVRFTAILAALLVLTGGAAFAEIETDQHLSAWDGIWWAATTVTTVGYGDIAPQTSAGRVIAIAVMLVGIGFVALLTGAVAETFLAGRRRGEADQHAEIIGRLDAINARLDQLEGFAGGGTAVSRPEPPH